MRFLFLYFSWIIFSWIKLWFEEKWIAFRYREKLKLTVSNTQASTFFFSQQCRPWAWARSVTSRGPNSGGTSNKNLNHWYTGLRKGKLKKFICFSFFLTYIYPHPVQTFFLLQLLIRIVLYDSHVPQLQIKIVVDQVHDVKIRIHVHPKIPNINMVSCSHPRSFCSTENMNFGGNIFVCKHSIYKRTVVSYIHTAPAYAGPHQILWVWVYKATKYLTR